MRRGPGFDLQHQTHIYMKRKKERNKEPQREKKQREEKEGKK
jgi:hypothetical protein